MSEPQPQPEQQQQQQQPATDELAELAPQTEVEYDQNVAQLRTVEVDGAEYQTDIPQGAELFYSQEGVPLLERKINIAETDKLPVGEYIISGQTEEMNDMGETSIVETVRPIKIVAVESGKAITVDSLEYSDSSWTLTEGSDELMTALGYEIAEVEGKLDIAAIPTPETAQVAARKLGVDLEYIDTEYALIPGKEYLRAYADGKYPASKKNFKHDFEDDHITAMVLGGETLKKALKVAATEGLRDGEVIVYETHSKTDLAATSLDSFTAELRAVVAPHAQIAGEAYSEQQGRKTLYTRGARIGMSHETVDEILATAQANARKFNMPVKNTA